LKNSFGLAVNGSSARILRKEKERLTAASLNNRFFIFLEVVSISSSLESHSLESKIRSRFICYLLIFCSVKPKEIKELARRWRENPKGNKEIWESREMS